MNIKKTVAVLISGLFFLLMSVPAQSAEFCVNDAASLQNALNTASGNIQENTIRLVQGTYSGNFTFYSTEGYGITLLGGYEPGCGSREIDPANTILDGGGSGRTLYLHYYGGSCGNIVVEGLTFRNGASGQGDGGGLSANAYCISGPGSAISVNKCAFSNNVGLSGGAAYIYSYSSAGAGGDLTITENTVTGNTAYDGFGGIYVGSIASSAASSGNITVSKNTFSTNTSYDQVGGIGVSSSSDTGTGGKIIFTENAITGNLSYSNSGGVYALTSSDAGVIGDITLSGNTVEGNTNYYGRGGGIHVLTYGNSSTAGGNIRLEKNTISGNTSYSDAGGVYVESSTNTGVTGEVTLVDNMISDNYAYDNGGGAYIQGRAWSTGNAGAVTLMSNIVQNNSAYEYYGGISVNSWSSSGATADVKMVNNMINKNKAIKGNTGGVYAESRTDSGTPGDITLTNNTIAGNTSVSVSGGAEFYLAGNTLNVYNNILWGNTSSSYPADLYFSSYGGSPFIANGYNNLVSAVSGAWTTSGGNIDVDPLFVNAAGGYYHILKTSPCRNAGLATAPEVPKKDFEGELRGRVDIGADEYPEASLSGILLLLLD